MQQIVLYEQNKLRYVENDALTGLNNLVMLDLNQNNFEGTFDSIPSSKKLDQLLLGFNSLQSIQNLERCPNLTVLDLHNNKIQTLPDSVCTLYQLKTLKITNYKIYRIFSNGEIHYLHPKDGFLPEKVQPERKAVNSTNYTNL